MRILVLSTTHAGTHKECIKVTLDCIPHFFRLAVAAPARTREHDSCDKTQEHKHEQEASGGEGSRRPRSRSLSYMRRLYWCTRLDCFMLAHLLCLQRGVLLSLDKFSHTLAERYGCEDNPEFWSQICLRGQRNEQSWEVPWKQTITFNSFRIFKAMQLLAKILNLRCKIQP